MKLAHGLLALSLLGCQSDSPDLSIRPAQPVPAIIPHPRPEVAPTPPRRPLARLNPRRQHLEVGEAPAPPILPRWRPMKVGVRIVPESPPRVGRLMDQNQAQLQQLNQSLNAQRQQRIERQNEALLAQEAEQRQRIQRQNELILAMQARQSEQIQRQNEALMNRPLPDQALTPQMQRVSYPQFGPSEAHRQAERRYLEARADFLNTKYLPPGSPPRYTADSVRGAIGTGMPLPPQMMNQPAMFNPVLQKAQQAEILRQEMVRTP